MLITERQTLMVNVSTGHPYFTSLSSGATFDESPLLHFTYLFRNGLPFK